jgi:hypothetical protein
MKSSHGTFFPFSRIIGDMFKDFTDFRPKTITFVSDVPRLSQKDFPGYRFIPGKNPHPFKAGGHWEQQGEPELAPITDWAANADYLYGIDLFNYGYFWESHVWFEAFWNAHGRKTPQAMILQSYIKVAAAGIKFQQGLDTAAIGHMARGSELAMAANQGVSESVIFGIDCLEVHRACSLVKSFGDIFKLSPEQTR